MSSLSPTLLNIENCRLNICGILSILAFFKRVHGKKLKKTEFLNSNLVE
jgi:hypothetical protein